MTTSPPPPPTLKLRSTWLPKFFNNPLCANISLTYRNARSPIAAHRSILAASSGTFAELFESHSKSGWPQPRAYYIDHKGQDPNAVLAMVQYMYSTSVSQFVNAVKERGGDWVTWCEIWELGVEFRMPGLVELAVQEFGDEVREAVTGDLGVVSKVVVKLYGRGRLEKDGARLKEMIVNVCSRHVAVLLEDKDFGELVKKSLSFAMDSLEDLDEKWKEMVKEKMVKRPGESEDFEVMKEDRESVKRVVR